MPEQHKSTKKHHKSKRPCRKPKKCRSSSSSSSSCCKPCRPCPPPNPCAGVSGPRISFEVLSIPAGATAFTIQPLPQTSVIPAGLTSTLTFTLAPCTCPGQTKTIANSSLISQNLIFTNSNGGTTTIGLQAVSTNTLFCIGGAWVFLTKDNAAVNIS